MKRFPLWLTVAPLVIGVAGWWVVWSGYRDDFARELSGALGREVSVGGFPYRLEARVEGARLGVDGPGLTAGGEAAMAVVNRQPWKPDHLVVNLQSPLGRVRVGPLLVAQAAIRADAAQASLHIERRPERAVGGRPSVARLSVVWTNAELTSALLPATLRAATLETHYRDIVNEPAPAGSATPARRVQIVASSEGARLGAGAPLRMEAEVTLHAARPIVAYGDWASGGTAELRRLVLSDADGEVARFVGTAVPDGRGGLRAAGTVATMCPATVRAMLLGQPAPAESRTRKAVVIAWSGMLGEAPALSAPEPAELRAPRRAQEGPCPRLR